VPLQQGTVVFKGGRELQRSLKRIGSEVARQMDAELRAGGEIVAELARNRFTMIDARSAAGFKSRTKGFGRVVVEQSRRRKTGLRPDFGKLQMRRALIPARSEGFDTVVRHLEGMLDRLGREEGF